MAVKLTIDGKNIEAKEGQTVLDVIREKSLGFIPTLCHSPKLDPIGACSLCVVEIEGMRGLPLACTTRVQEGMTVTAHNDRLENIRKTAVDLLLSNHNADCIGPCRLNCPTGVDVQAYLSLAKLGEFERGLNLVREKNPLPASVGRICVRYCELACRRKEVDEPISINMVKRYLADHALESPFPDAPEMIETRGVAIIGGGPGGLTAAHYLRQQGIKSTIFDMREKLGGMMRYGIPDYRLPQEILDQEINHILSQGGIEVRTGVKLGRDMTISALHEEYDAVFLAMGAQGTRALRMDGEDMEGVESALEFLINVKNQGLPDLSGKNVVVLGGGNTAIDVSRTALRAGANVRVLYRRTEHEMPADAYEVEEAREEGVVFEFLQSPVGLIGENGRLRQVKMQKMELGEPDDSGRRRPVPVKDSEFMVDADYCFAAIGQITDLGNAIDDGTTKVPVTSWRTIATLDGYGRTAIPWLFAGGDVVLGPAAVIDAIGHGRKSALAMAEMIKKRKLINRFNVDQENPFLSTKDTFGGLPEYETAAIPKGTRNWYPARDPEVRKKSYSLEVQMPPSAEAATEEASKCLFCGCADFEECDLRFLGDVYKLPRPTFKGDSPRRPIEKRNPYFEIDPNKCVLCMRCVRYCDEYMHVDALAFKDRGFETQVEFRAGDFDESVCTGCGNCTEICPTGAIIQKDDFGIITPIKHDTKATVCQLCPAACEVSVHQYTERMISVRSRKLGTDDFTDLCGTGRYGNSVVKDDRLTKPMVREDGELKETDWDTAINAAAGLMKGNLAGLLSPYATNQQMVAFSRLIREAGGLVGSRYELYTGVGPDNLGPDTILGQGNASYSDIDNTDFIFLLNPEAVQKQEVIWHRILRARYDNGAQLVIPSGFDSGLAKHATIRFDVPKGMISGMLTGAVQHISEGCNHPISERIEDVEVVPELLSLGNKLSAMVRDAKNPLIVFGTDGSDSAYAQDLWLAYMLAKVAHDPDEPKLLMVRQPFNAGGLWITGSTERSEGAETTFEILRDTADATFVLFRDNPSADAKDLATLKKAKHVVVFDTHNSALLDYADVVLPVELPFESGGSIVNGEGKVVEFGAGIRSKVEKATLEVLADLAKKLGKDLGDINAEIQRRFSLYKTQNLPALPFDVGDKSNVPNMLDTFATRARQHFIARGKAETKDMVVW